MRGLKGRNVLVGRSLYKETPIGYTMGEMNGFVEVIVDAETKRILGANVIGPIPPF